MKKRANQRWQPSLLTVIAIFILFGAPVSVFGKDNRFTTDYLFQSTAGQYLQLSNAFGNFNFTNTKSNNLFAVNFNQDDSNYPKPDFSAMEKWFEIGKYEYDFFTEPLLPRLYFIVKPKVENPPGYFKMKFADADGVALMNYQVHGLRLPYIVGEPQRIYGMAPKEKDMRKVKSIVVSRIVE